MKAALQSFPAPEQAAPETAALETLNRGSLRPAADAAPVYDLIELLFFAYRDFVGDPDRILEKYGFGRAHHRVLHFVNRHPGLTIAALLDILKITKQSLNRVLKELIEQGYIDSRAGEMDRRQRLLFPTALGQGLARDLAMLQTTRINRAVAECGPAASEAARHFLEAMIDPTGREELSQTAAAAAKAQGRLT